MLLLESPRNNRRVTFDACKKAKPCTSPLETMPRDEAIARSLGTFDIETGTGKRTVLEAVSQRNTCEYIQTSPQINQFHHAVFMAFNNHYPLVLSPDMIWLVIAQGVASHIHQNSEEVRQKFVDFQGKKKLFVYRDNFVKGSLENDWEGVFSEFSEQIRGYIGRDNHDLFTPTFSTTGLTERAATELALINIVQEFFEFGVVSLCGIPRFTLEGEVSDWQELTRRAGLLADFGLEWWTRSLIPMLQEFEVASAGVPNRAFWESFYKYESRSGGSQITGALVNLFPYIKTFIWDKATDSVHTKLVPNPALDNSQIITVDQLPDANSSVPFEWNYVGQKYEMEILSGFLGVEQEPDTLALRPGICWAVRDKTN